jgi:hypothetical protein
MIAATRSTVALLLLIAAAHLWRLLLGVQVTVGSTTVPFWASGVGTIVPVALAIALRRERRP